MLGFFNRLIVALLLVALAVVVTLSNSEPASIRLGSGFQVTTYAGVIYLAVFASGAIAASLVGLYFGVKGYLRERRLVAAERARQQFFELFVTGRNTMASHEWSKARGTWEQILRKDPDNVIARVELSRCLESLGDSREALRVLDSTRASSRRNAEVLLRAAELNRQLGNNTAAMDNLALVVSDTPSERSLVLARDLSEEMARIDDALEYQNELERLGFTEPGAKVVRARLTLAQILRDAPDATTLRETLLGFVRRNPTFVPALEKLAQIELDRGAYEEGAELLVKSAKASGGAHEKWQRVIDLWLHEWPGDPRKKAERALSAARASTQDVRGTGRIRAELTVVQTLLSLNKAEEALRIINELPTLAAKDNSVVTPELDHMMLTLKGACLARLGFNQESGEVWQALVEPNAGKAPGGSPLTPRDISTVPSPRLSTP
jgi:tetratricopeptide (TPR) repeat protein